MRYKLSRIQKSYKKLKYKETVFIDMIGKLKDMGCPVDQVYK